jgi:sugar-phosphatase
MAVSAAVFDLDGTLVTSEERNALTWTAFFTDHRIHVDDALLASVTGRRGRDSLAELADYFPGRSPEELLEELWRTAERLDLPPIRPVPGAVDLVERVAAAGAPIALVTSAHRAYAEELLGELGVREHFRVLVTAEDVRRGKPDPEGYLRACAGIHVEPADAVGFEDSVAGIAALRAAGLSVVAVTTSTSAAALADADLVVPDLTGVQWPPLAGSAATSE